MSAEIFKYQVKVRTADWLTLCRHSCNRQLTEGCGAQCAAGQIALTELTKTYKQTNKQKKDIPTNYPIILYVLWIPSFITVFTTAPPSPEPDESRSTISQAVVQRSIQETPRTTSAQSSLQPKPQLRQSAALVRFYL